MVRLVSAVRASAAIILAAALNIATVSAQTTPVTIVALGASNTEGWGLPPSDAYPVQLQGQLRAKGIDATVLNAGVAGDTTGGMLARLENAVPAGARLVILQPGTNDERMGLSAERAANIDKMRKRLRARGVKLLVIENSMLDALPRSELRADGVHFTPAGYVLLVERILPDVIAALGD